MCSPVESTCSTETTRGADDGAEDEERGPQTGITIIVMADNQHYVNRINWRSEQLAVIRMWIS